MVRIAHNPKNAQEEATLIAEQMFERAKANIPEMGEIYANPALRYSIIEEGERYLKALDQEKVWSSLFSVLNIEKYENVPILFYNRSKPEIEHALDTYQGGTLSSNGQGINIVEVTPYGFFVNQQISNDNPWISLLSHQYSFFVIDDRIARAHYSEKKLNIKIPNDDLNRYRGIHKGLQLAIEEAVVDKLSNERGEDVVKKRIAKTRNHSEKVFGDTKIIDSAERVWIEVRKKGVDELLRVSEKMTYYAKIGYPSDVEDSAVA